MRVLKPGGWFAISTPWKETIKQSCYGGDLHLWSFDEEDMQKLGFTEITTLTEVRTISMLAWQQKLAQ
jgi:DNA modification methylase